MKKTQKITSILILLFILVHSTAYSQSNYLQILDRETAQDSIGFIQINTDSLFNREQKISIFALRKSLLDKYKIEIAYNEKELEKTSYFGETYKAEAAINGSYFDVDRGGSVTYLEINDSVISRTRAAKSKWAKPGKLINGAVIIKNNNKIIFDYAKPDGYYESSKKENAVLVSGPVLILNSHPVKLADMKFVNKRHPRTFIGKTEKFIVFITVDGRSEDAGGMNLIEAQKFLMDLGCTDAINLDGGGSTTMWIKSKGVVNHPSDITGERPVANAILLLLPETAIN